MRSARPPTVTCRRAVNPRLLAETLRRLQLWVGTPSRERRRRQVVTAIPRSLVAGSMGNTLCWRSQARGAAGVLLWIPPPSAVAAIAEQRLSPELEDPRSSPSGPARKGAPRSGLEQSPRHLVRSPLSARRRGGGGRSRLHWGAPTCGDPAASLSVGCDPLESIRTQGHDRQLGWRRPLAPQLEPHQLEVRGI